MKTPFSIFITDESQMVALGCHVGAKMSGGVIYLEGDLGAGKTTFCRGVLQGRGHKGTVKSPTYTLVEPYDLASGTVYHFDLYRLGNPEELEFIGVRDYFLEENLCLVEWAERGRGFLAGADVTISITVEGEGRGVVIMPLSKVGDDLITAITDETNE